YFAVKYARNREYPDELLDTNVASDYGKIRLDPNYQFALELKYLKQADAQRLEQVKQQGLTQLQNYLQHDKLHALKDLRAWLLVFVGTEAKVVTEVTASP